MNRLVDSTRMLLGGNPSVPSQESMSLCMRELHARHDAARNPAAVRLNLEAHRAKQRGPQTWRRRRWCSLIVVNLMFVVSYWLDIQLVEGALTGSRFVGFHMADLNAALQVMLAFKVILVNLVIGTVTVFLVWWLLGGRTFCSWVCPYHLLAEFADVLHVRLARKGLVKDHPLSRRARAWLWLTFAMLAFVTGYTVFETISPTGIVSRALIYGPGLAMFWVVFLLLIEVFYTRRAWCRYICPIGLTYGFVGATSPLRVVYHADKCTHDGLCRPVCLVPHVLDVVLRGRATAEHQPISADCTRCGRCVDVCPHQALTFEFKGLKHRR